jgi:hypothetical protein
MFNNIKIGTKIKLVVALVVLLGIVTTSFVTFNLNKKSIEEKYINTLSVISQAKSDKINDYFSKLTDATQHMRSIEGIKTNLGYYRDFYDENPDSIISLIGYNLDGYTSPFAVYHGFTNIIITNRSGEIIFLNNTVDQDQVLGNKFKDPDGMTIERSKDDIYYSEDFEQDGVTYIYIGSPLIDDFNQYAGLLFLKVSLEPVFKITQDYKGLGKTGETILLRQKNNKLFFLNQSRHRDAISENGGKQAV